MIETFRCKDTEALFNDTKVSAFQAIERPARRKLFLLHRAKHLKDLAVPAGNRLEALRDDRAGQYSIRVNDRWRLCFVWRDGNAYEVEIVDHH